MDGANLTGVSRFLLLKLWELQLELVPLFLRAHEDRCPHLWSRLPPEWLWSDQWCYRTNCFLRYTCRQLQVCCELWNSLQLLTIWRDHFKEAWGKVSSTHCLLVLKGMWFVDLKSSEIIEKCPKIHQINALRIYVSETFPAWGLCSTEGLRKSQKRKMHLITGTLSEV